MRFGEGSLSGFVSLGISSLEMEFMANDIKASHSGCWEKDGNGARLLDEYTLRSENKNANVLRESIDSLRLHT